MEVNKVKVGHSHVSQIDKNWIVTTGSPSVVFGTNICEKDQRSNAAGKSQLNVVSVNYNKVGQEENETANH